MKCINKRLLTMLLAGIMSVLLMGCSEETESVLQEYESSKYCTTQYTGVLISEPLCVSEDAVSLDGFEDDSFVDAIGLFDLNDKEVLYAYNAHEKIYPASITKIMTALLTLEYGNLDDMVTISATADSSNLSIYAQQCGIKEGDVWRLGDLLDALLIYSGNDVALAIAEHIGGSVDNFVNMMNRKAHELCAVNTHFMNPHGLHDEMHYSTVYDLYLIFNECIKNEKFLEIINKDSTSIEYTSKNGSSVTVKYEPTNLYASGEASKPKNVTIIGGKTGTTHVYSRCLILLSKDSKDNPYISVVIGAPDKTILYNDMTALIEAIP